MANATTTAPTPAVAENNLGPIKSKDMLTIESITPKKDDRNGNKRYSLVGGGKNCVFVARAGRALPKVGQKIVFAVRDAVGEDGPYEGKFWLSTFDAHMGSNLALQERLYEAEQLAAIRVNEATQRAAALNAGSAAKVASEL